MLVGQDVDPISKRVHNPLSSRTVDLSARSVTIRAGLRLPCLTWRAGLHCVYMFMYVRSFGGLSVQGRSNMTRDLLTGRDRPNCSGSRGTQSGSRIVPFSHLPIELVEIHISGSLWICDTTTSVVGALAVTSPTSVRAVIRRVALLSRVTIDTVNGDILYMVTITRIAC